MEVSRMVSKINLNTDEDFELTQVLEFMNDAIQKINIECGAIFPEIDMTLPENMYEFEEYTALPDKWINGLIIPFAAGRIKENDSSQFEYTDWYAQFDQNLQMFRTRYTIPDVYLDADDSEGRYEDDYSQSMFSHLKGW